MMLSNSLYSGIDFYTQNKTTTSLWKETDVVSAKASLSMPTHS